MIMNKRTYQRILSTVGLVAASLWASHPALAENIIYHQGWPYSWLGKVEKDDKMGASLAMGDFNNDGFADIAVGVPGEDVNVNGANVSNSGAVNILYGSLEGPRQYDESVYTLSTFNAGYKALPGQAFGSALAVGDFNCDTYADLVIGVPGYGLTESSNRGAIFVIYGHSQGLNTTHTTSFAQEQISNNPREDGDQFGKTLLAKDFTGDGCDDLAVGAPYEDGILNDVGVVHILYGHKSGLNAPGALKSKMITQDDLSKGDGQKADDYFGSSFASGDFNHDGYNDLAIGAYAEDGTVQDVGYVHVLKGGAGGITTSGDAGYAQENLSYTIAFPKKGYQWDRFSFSLAAGNFDSQAGDDLLIGTPGDHSAATECIPGSITQLKSYGAGLSTIANLFIGGYQVDCGPTVGGELIGNVMVAGNFNGDSYDDVAFSAWNVFGVPASGLLAFEYGNFTNGAFATVEGLDAGNEDDAAYEDYFEFEHGSLEGQREGLFGLVTSMAAGDINGDGLDDIVLGLPGQTIKSGGNPNTNIYYAGAIAVWLNDN